MLNGSPAERLLKPITDYIEARGGRIHTRWGCRCAQRLGGLGSGVQSTALMASAKGGQAMRRRAGGEAAAGASSPATEEECSSTSMQFYKVV